MEIRVKNGDFVAFCTEDNELGTTAKKGNSLGRMSMRTGKFEGATVCMIALQQKFEEHQQRKAADKGKLIENVIRQIKQDIGDDNTSSIKTLLTNSSDEDLESFLSEL